MLFRSTYGKIFRETGSNWSEYQAIQARTRPTLAVCPRSGHCDTCFLGKGIILLDVNTKRLLTHMKQFRPCQDLFHRVEQSHTTPFRARCSRWRLEWSSVCWLQPYFDQSKYPLSSTPSQDTARLTVYDPSPSCLHRHQTRPRRGDTVPLTS